MKKKKVRRGDAIYESHVEQYVKNFTDALKSGEAEQYFSTAYGLRTGEFMGSETYEGLLNLTDIHGNKPDGILTYIGLAWEDKDFHISPVKFIDGRECKLHPRLFAVPVDKDGNALVFEALGRRTTNSRSLYGMKDDDLNGAAGGGGPHPPWGA